MDIPIILVIIITLIGLILFKPYFVEGLNDEAISNVASLYNNQNMIVSKMTLGSKFEVSGIGDKLGNDGWLRLMKPDSSAYADFAAGQLYSASVGGTVKKVRDDLNSRINSLDSKINDVNKKAAKNNLRCRTAYTKWNNRGAGRTEYLDRHTAYCSSNEFMQGFKLDRNGNKIRWRFRCCRFK